MTLTLSDPEAELLTSVLTERLAETRSEIHHTDTASYRDELHREESILKAILEKLQSRA